MKILNCQLRIISSVVVCMLACSCSKNENMSFFIADQIQDYRSLKISETPQSWEDGRRTEMSPGTFEWWYFDCVTKDGSYFTIVFFKALTNLEKDPEPFISVRIRTPDGKLIEVEEKGDSELDYMSTEGLDIKVGKSWVKGNFGKIQIHVETLKYGVNAELELVSQSKPWRPGTGVWYFGPEKEKYFAWFVAVPRGKMNGAITLDGKKILIQDGDAYHDHNWGSEELNYFWNSWWWSRASFKEYTVLAALLTPTKPFGAKKFPLLLIMKGNEVLVEDYKNISYELGPEHDHPVSHKKVHNWLKFKFKDDRLDASFFFRKNKDNTVLNLLDLQPFWKRTLAKILGYSPWYYRLSMDGELEIKSLPGEASHIEPLKLKSETTAEFMSLE